jgi:ribonuclease P protein component
MSAPSDIAGLDERGVRAPARLKRRPEFLAVASKGRKMHMPGVIVQALRHDEPGRVARENEQEPDKLACDQPPRARIGFTATRKIGNAVTRNRARRRLREAARLVFAEHPVVGTDFVLIARKETPRRRFALLRAELLEAIGRLAPR